MKDYTSYVAILIVVFILIGCSSIIKKSKSNNNFINYINNFDEINRYPYLYTDSITSYKDLEDTLSTKSVSQYLISEVVLKQAPKLAEFVDKYINNNKCDETIPARIDINKGIIAYKSDYFIAIMYPVFLFFDLQPINFLYLITYNHQGEILSVKKISQIHDVTSGWAPEQKFAKIEFNENFIIKTTPIVYSWSRNSPFEKIDTLKTLTYEINSQGDILKK